MKVFFILSAMLAVSSAFADPVATEVCIGIPNNSTEQVCISKQQVGENSASYIVSISDAGQTVTVDSTKSYLGVDPAQLTNGMASVFTGGFNPGEMAHYMGPTDDALKAVANGTLPSSYLDRETIRIAHGLSLHTPAN